MNLIWINFISLLNLALCKVQTVSFYRLRCAGLKNTTYPTDAKLPKEIVGKVLKVVQSLHLPVCQSNAFVLKKVYRYQYFYNLPKNRTKAFKTDKHLWAIARRLVGELKYSLGSNKKYDKLIPI